MIWLFVLILMIAIEAPSWLWLVWFCCVVLRWLFTFYGMGC